MQAVVQDNPALSRYEMEVDGRVAFASYRDTPAALVIHHTEVPRALEGRGIGTSLVKGTLDLVRAKGRKVVPRCSFVASVIARHPEYRDLLAGP